MAAATAALVTHQDVSTSIHTATNAVENNALFHLICYPVTAARVIYSIYQVHQTYQQEGLVPMLQHLGIEVVTNVALGGAGRVAKYVAAP